MTATQIGAVGAGCGCSVGENAVRVTGYIAPPVAAKPTTMVEFAAPSAGP